MKKETKLGLILALVCLILVGSTACNTLGGDEEKASQQLVEVVRGDLTVSVSGSGTVEVANEAKLAFGIGGKVDRIYVEEGDEVSAGDVLAELDTDDLELALTQVQVAYTQAQVSVTQAQLAVTQAQVALQGAEIELDYAENKYEWPDIEIARADVDRARLSVEYAQDRLEKAPDDQKETWAILVARAQGSLAIAEEKLNAMLSGADTEEVALKKLQAEAAQQSLELAQQSLKLHEQSLKLHEQSLERAQKQLDETTITASFDGVVASVYVDEGDVIPSPNMGPKIIIYLLDLTTMELSVEVDEIDIPGVELGQRVVIEADALPTLPLEGEVTFISPLAKEEAGVVLYEVKVGFNVPEGSGLRVGMSADADIVIAERSSVLLVPRRAITKDSQGNPVVKVMVGEQTQERPVVTGLSDGFETEIVDGLEEGEVVEGRAR